ncbi:hypothetical protein ACFLZ0_02460 [Patescibacteria group bacterium]
MPSNFFCPCCKKRFQGEGFCEKCCLPTVNTISQQNNLCLCDVIGETPLGKKITEMLSNGENMKVRAEIYVLTGISDGDWLDTYIQKLWTFLNHPLSII